MPVKFKFYTGVYRVAGLREYEVNLVDKQPLSKLIKEDPFLSELFTKLNESGINYIIILNGERVENDPIVGDGDTIKVFSLVSGGV